MERITKGVGSRTRLGAAEPIAMPARLDATEWEHDMRRSRTRGISFDQFRLFAFGSDEELVAAFGSLKQAGDAWLSVREQFLERWHLWGMPEAWWRFEREIPDELRCGPHAIITAEDAAQWRRIDTGRRAYLSSLGVDPIRRRRRSWRETERE